MGAALREPQQSEPKHLQTKGLAYTTVKIPQEFRYPTEKLRKENLKILILLFFFHLPHHAYRIHSIKRRGYHLFQHSILCCIYLRAAAIRERRLLESGVYLTQ